MHFPREELEDPGLGLTPLVDVVFLLLIFFIVTTSFTEPRIALELPEAESAEVASTPPPRTVTLARDGALLFDGEPTTLEALPEHFAAAGGGELELQADEEVPHGRVVRVLDLARTHGLTEISITVERPASGAR